MTDFLRELLKMLLKVLPLILFAWLNSKVNLKRSIRSRQFLMPLLSLLYGLIALYYINEISELVNRLLLLLPQLLHELAMWLRDVMNGRLYELSLKVQELELRLSEFLYSTNISYLVCCLCNALLILAHVLLKWILILILKGIFAKERKLHHFVADPFYQYDEGEETWYVRSNIGQARTYLKTMYVVGTILAGAWLITAAMLYKKGLLHATFYPVFGLIPLGELYFFLNGLTHKEAHREIYGEDSEEAKYVDYSLLRNILRKLYPDKLSAEDTKAAKTEEALQSNKEFLDRLEEDEDIKLEAYGIFMQRQIAMGLEPDLGYLMSGEELLRGQSILFNNPFYRDLKPYVFYPMNRALLRHKRVLIILGRHNIDEDIRSWCEEGLTTVTGVPEMWRIGNLTEEEQDLHVGIVTRSDVHNLALHEANDSFFKQVEFVVLIEPSRLLTTAQVGLNSLIRHCRTGEKKLVYCSTDKNCDGLVDALSHVLMTSLTEVSATVHYTGDCSYMCWEADSDYWQHRMLPNLSRYLGVGTELSFLALRNQVSQTEWYGGEAFPVVDLQWIAKQYYYDLLHFANLPVNQETMNRYFRLTPNLWDADKKKYNYITVEDEAFNMFEAKRVFSTRGTEQSFINVLSSEYLLREYMARNNSIFDADPKAIPYIVADYARSPRNVCLRLCLRMSVGEVSETDLHREMMLIDCDGDDVIEAMWTQLCNHCGLAEAPVLRCKTAEGAIREFTSKVIRSRKKYSMDTGKMEVMYSIRDKVFQRVLLDDLLNAQYIAEDESGKSHHIGTELRGSVLQKYLPGQFFTFGGKYYEMLRLASDGQVLIRRAADHINGRPSYRQVRQYTLEDITDSTVMGDQKNFGGMKLTKQYANVTVDTPAYWQMDRYNDFATGKYVDINGVPTRHYLRKQVLRIDLPETAGDGRILQTVTLLLNEVFRTLFAENHPYIAALCCSAEEAPFTYSLKLEGGDGTNCIYIVEDSQLDIGLLCSVERNMDRIMGIICDYLEWHLKTLEESLNPPPAVEPAPPYEPSKPEPGTEKGKKKGFWKRIAEFFKKIGAFFKKLFKKIGDFFRKLFRRKKAEPAGETPVEGEVATPVADGNSPQEMPEAGDQVTQQGETEEASEAVEAAPVEEASEGGETSQTEENTSEEAVSGNDSDETEEPEEEAFQAMCSMYHGHFSLNGEEGTPEEPTAEEPQPGGDSQDDREGDDLEFEPEQVVNGVNIPKRKPYHECYFLLYGQSQLPPCLDPEGTLEFLRGLGYDKNPLKQAREGINTAELMAQDYDPNRPGSSYCDFCGAELSGVEFDVLKDGRERCKNCGRTAIRTAAEFEAIYKEAVRNMSVFFGIRIDAPVKVSMVNSKTLHRQLKRTFVPTGNFDGRVLGVAIRKGKSYTVLLENGAPRMESIKTIVHEMTHIWQYLNWNDKDIKTFYGPEMELEVYEGMAKWVEIQYVYLLGEKTVAKREELITLMRQDEYGFGFQKYAKRYPLSYGTKLEGKTPFLDPKRPL